MTTPPDDHHSPIGYHSRDQRTGIWPFGQIARTVRWVADDHEQFMQGFVRMSEALAERQGRKARRLHLHIEAHPWIHQRVMKVLRAAQAPGHGYGDFVRSKPVHVHLTASDDPVGQHHVIGPLAHPLG